MWEFTDWDAEVYCFSFYGEDNEKKKKKKKAIFCRNGGVFLVVREARSQSIARSSGTHNINIHTVKWSFLHHISNRFWKNSNADCLSRISLISKFNVVTSRTDSEHRTFLRWQTRTIKAEFFYAETAFTSVNVWPIFWPYLDIFGVLCLLTMNRFTWTRNNASTAYYTVDFHFSKAVFSEFVVYNLRN